MATFVIDGGREGIKTCRLGLFPEEGKGAFTRRPPSNKGGDDDGDGDEGEGGVHCGVIDVPLISATRARCYLASGETESIRR